MAASEKIRVRLKSYEHTLVDSAAAKIVEIAKRNGAEVSGPVPLPTDKRSSRSFARSTSTRTAASSSSRELTRDLSRSESPRRRSSKLSCPWNFPRVWTSISSCKAKTTSQRADLTCPLEINPAVQSDKGGDPLRIETRSLMAARSSWPRANQ